MNNPRRIQRHLVKALAAGAVLVAAALPLAIAGSAGAATDAIQTVVFTPSNAANFGTGATGTVTLTGTFAGDGGNATLTTSAPGVTFTSVVDTSPTTVTADYASTSATLPGVYNLTLTDDQGTVIDNDAFTVNAAPSISAITPATLPDTTGNTASVGYTMSGTFVGTPTVVLTNTANGTTAEATAGASGGTTSAPATSDTIIITPVNPITTRPATPGTYTATITNPDGGTYTSGAIFTITGNEITSVTPSAIPFTATGDTTLTLSGGGFENGATVTLGTCPDVTIVPNTVDVTSATSLTVEIANAGGETLAAQCDLTVDNASSSDNGASYDAVGALGVGEGDNLAPVITTSSLTTGSAIVPGASASTITLTGSGFSQYTVPGVTYVGTTADPSALVTGPCIVTNTGSSLTCELAVSTDALTGAHSVTLENGTTAQQGATPETAPTGSLANAFSVAGPVITSAAPTALAVNAPIGTTVVLTGTGFANTSTGSVSGTTGLLGNFVYVSATTEDFVVTTPPSLAGSAVLTVSTVDSYGANEISAPFTLPVDNGPSITSITYATGTTGVGIGATAQTVTINGSGFESGATVTAFTNATGTADADVTAKVTAVNTVGTQITATIAVAAGDTNAIDGYTVTNPDGGTAKASAVAPAGLAIDAAPTITAVSPVTATPAATNAFTVTGTGFQTGATVVLSSDGTCGTATVASATSLTASCTIGEPGTAAVTLSVVNPDGGTATSGTILAAKAAGTTSTFHVTNPAHGTAIAGKTSTLTISGTGFYGQPKITSNAAGTKVGVSKDSGKVLTIRVTTKATTGAGEHTFTIRLANGKTGKANYAVKK